MIAKVFAQDKDLNMTYEIVKKDRNGRDQVVNSGPLTRRQADREIRRRSEDISPSGTFRRRPFSGDWFSSTRHTNRSSLLP